MATATPQYTLINCMDKTGVMASLYRNEKPKADGSDKYVVSHFIGTEGKQGIIDYPFPTRRAAAFFRSTLRKQ